MNIPKRDVILFGLIFSVLICSSFAHVFAGSFHLSTAEFFQAITSFNSIKTQDLIVWEFRIPRLTIALLGGAGLSLAGMLMQTLFNNPLAGPYVLGINSGSALFVACCAMIDFTFFKSDIGLISGAIIGSMTFGTIILIFSIFIPSQISLLLIGLMLGSFAGALISVIQTISDPNALKAFTMWTMGSLQNVELQQIPTILIVFCLGLVCSFVLVKPLNVMLLGEKTTRLLGLNIKQIRFVTILVTSLFTGLITAFCGPIAFVGLAIPNLARYLFRTQSHGKLIIANLLLGSTFLVCSDLLLQLMENVILLPINAFTSIIGAPLVILFVIKKVK